MDIIKLYQEMADHTKGECAHTCKRPYSCCSPEYCEMAIEWADEQYKVKLERTDHPTLPLMGPQGCTAAPHFRPCCTVHTCDIAGLGFKPYDDPWTDKYYALRDKINKQELLNFKGME